ncbi:MAG: type I methionyl aminopeptidase [Bacteriovoracaceae bacterium]
MIKLKSSEEIILYRETGKIAGEILAILKEHVKIGENTYDIAKFAEDLIVNKYKAIPSSIGQYDFKFALNSSINNVICHGVPSKQDILKDGDIINLDLTVKKHGLIADTSRMYFVGNVSSDAYKLCKVAYECLWKGIEQVKPGNTVGDIGYAIQRHATRNDYAVVREYCGHGIGQKMHEEPQIAHFGNQGKGTKIQKGMTFTIEPMINQGSRQIDHLDDDWTVVTRDGNLSAQWEHTILVTDNGYEILTLREEESKKFESWF